jgi:hypothetical protein
MGCKGIQRLGVYFLQRQGAEIRNSCRIPAGESAPSQKIDHWIRGLYFMDRFFIHIDILYQNLQFVATAFRKAISAIPAAEKNRADY